MKKINKNLIGFIFTLLAIISYFFINNILGVIIAIFSIFINYINLKSKHKNIIITISFIVSIILVLIALISFIISIITSNSVSTYKKYEEELETLASDYIKDIGNSGNTIRISLDELKEYNKDIVNKDCDGYIIYNETFNMYDAYIKCDKYTTSGYSEE